MSLKIALERLIDAPCYHMIDFVQRSKTDSSIWLEALHGDQSQIEGLLSDFGAAVDWPAALFWRELSQIYPQAIVILSVRSSREEWWRSISRTIGAADRQSLPAAKDRDLVSQFRSKAGIGESWADELAAKTMYDRLSAEVIELVPSSRLVVWRPSDGWEPICDALGLACPKDLFPHVNRSEEFYQHR